MPDSAREVSSSTSAPHRQDDSEMRRLIGARTSTTRLLARSFASSSARTNVSIVYGSFERGYSLASANEIKVLAPSDASLHIHDVQSGNAFDFNSLRETDYLIVCTSSQNGYPPENLTEFAHQLYLAAMTGRRLPQAPSACGMGEGDPRWFETYMDVPRFVDRLLEDCGSRRFYARGEAMSRTRRPRCRSARRRNGRPECGRRLYSSRRRRPVRRYRRRQSNGMRCGPRSRQ